MDLETKQHRHLVPDAINSDVGEDLDQNRLLFNSINSIINKNKYSLLDNSTVIKIDDTKDFSELSKLLTVPVSGYNNYISRSQNWIGHVIEIAENEFTAKLEDKNNPTTYEIAQFDIDEVSQGDQEMLKLGALFYWSVGKASINGQIIKQSMLRFKRSVDVTEEEFDHIMDNVNRQDSNINWD